MHLSLSTFKLLLISPLFRTLIIATPAPAPALLDLGKGRISESRIKLPKYSSSAAWQDLDGNLLIYYQTSDGAIHELSGYGIPDSSNFYSDEIVIEAGEARKGSPLAATDANYASEYDVNLYYISPENQLKEAIRSRYKPDPGSRRKWYFGGFDFENIFVKPDSQDLWAVTIATGNRFVGYVAPDGYLSGIAYNGATGKRSSTYIY